MLQATLAFLAVPPINLLLLCAAGCLMQLFAGLPRGLPRSAPLGLRHGLRRAGSAATAVGVAGLLVLSLPGVSSLLLLSLEAGPVLAAPPGVAPGAIVILGGDVSLDATVPPSTGLGPLSLERVRAGAALARDLAKLGNPLPILVTGGVIVDDWPALSALMAGSLTTDFDQPVRWQEPRSADTWENAEYSATILKAAGIHSVYLVTHAWHMRRALMAFRHFGIAVVPAPVRRDVWPKLVGGEFVPRASSWLTSYFALHEWIGCAEYALRG